MEIIGPKRQDAWGWPAAANFILGGMGTGFYLTALLALTLAGEASAFERAAPFKVFGPLLTLIGLAVLAFEAGRPLRGRYLLGGLSSSWMSREVLAAAVFVPSALLDFFFPAPLLRLCAAAAAAAFLLSQGFIVYRARALATWNRPLAPILFILSGLTMGSGLLILSASTGGSPPDRLAAGIAFLLLMIDLAAWLLFRKRSSDGNSRPCLKTLNRPGFTVLTVGVGHLLPIVLTLPLALLPASALWEALPVLAGWSILIGGSVQKGGILLKAGYFRGIVLERSKDDPARPLLRKDGGMK
jgi:DMSO reductase anchor subunit